MGVSASSFSSLLNYNIKFSRLQQKSFLRSSPFFVHTTEEQLELLVDCFVPHLVKSENAITYSEKQIMLVGKGEVRVSMLLPDFQSKQDGKLFLCIKRAGDILNPAASMKRATEPVQSHVHSKLASMLSDLHMLAVGEVVLLYLNRDALEALAAQNNEIKDQVEPLLGSHLIDYLRNLMFAKDLKSESQLQLFAEMCRYETFDANTVLFSEGDAGERFYILTSGECEVRAMMNKMDSLASPALLDYASKRLTLAAVPNFGLKTKKSKVSILPYQAPLSEPESAHEAPAHSVKLRTLKAGDFIGEAAFLMNVPRTSTVVTMDKCLFITCEKTFFNNLMKVAPDLKARFQLDMIERLLHRLRFMSNPYLKTFEETQLRDVAQYCTLEEYVNGDMIFKKDEAFEALYFIIHGQVSLQVPNVTLRSNSFSEKHSDSRDLNFSSPQLLMKHQTVGSKKVQVMPLNIQKKTHREVFAKTGDYIAQESLAKGSVNSTAIAMGRCVLLRLDSNVHKILESHNAMGRWDIMAKRNKCRLRDVLRFFDAAEALRRFLEKELSVENLRFIRAVQKWKELEINSQFKVAAEEIIEEYIREGSPSQVNISNKLRNHVLENIQKADITNDFFDESFKEVYLLLERDSFKRFIKSPFFKDLLHKMGSSMDVDAVDSESIQKLKQRLGLQVTKPPRR